MYIVDYPHTHPDPFHYSVSSRVVSSTLNVTHLSLPHVSLLPKSYSLHHSFVLSVWSPFIYMTCKRYTPGRKGTKKTNLRELDNWVYVYRQYRVKFTVVGVLWKNKWVWFFLESKETLGHRTIDVQSVQWKTTNRINIYIYVQKRRDSGD